MRRPFDPGQTAYLAANGAIVFFLLGFINLTPDITKGVGSYWRLWATFLERDFVGGDIIAGLTVITGMFTVVSVVVGWVLQAIVVAAFAMMRRHH